nr:transposase [Belnapia sp. F-4-1]
MHPVVGGAVRILAFTVTPVRMGDRRATHGLLANLPPPAFCAADAAYDSDGLRHFLLGCGTTPVIPNNPPRKHPQPFDVRFYRIRNTVERTIGRLKDGRRIHTQYDKLAANSTSAIAGFDITAASPAIAAVVCSAPLKSKVRQSSAIAASPASLAVSGVYRKRASAAAIKLRARKRPPCWGA